MSSDPIRRLKSIFVQYFTDNAVFDSIQGMFCAVFAAKLR